MRSSLLAIAATVCALVGDASAEQIAHRCTCPHEINLPPPGTTMVPANAKKWHIGAFGGVHKPTVVATPDVIGVRTSTEEWHRIVFSEADHTPPAVPGDPYISISLGDDDGPYYRVASLAVRGRYDADVVLVRIDIHDGNGVVSLITTPQDWWLCDPGAVLVGKNYTAEVRTIDLAGNESIPVAAQVRTSIASAQLTDRCGNYPMYEHEQYGSCVPFFLVPLGAYILGLAVWLVFLAIRRGDASRTPGEPLSALAAEEVLRRRIGWELVWGAMMLTLILGLYYSGEELYAALLGPVGIVALCRLFDYRWARSLLARPDATVVRHGRWLCVSSGRNSQMIRASRRDLAAGERASIPRSIAR